MSEARGWRKRQIVNKQEQNMTDFHDIQRPIATGVTSPWAWLTREEITEAAKWADKHGHGEWCFEFANALQKQIKEKNT